MRKFFAVVVGLFVLSVYTAAQIDPKTALLERAGWDALNAGNAHAAAESFRNALSGDPKNARLYLGAGVAAYLERRDADAKSALERALELDPRLVDARFVLAQTFYRLGDLPGAIRTIERFLADAPGHPQGGELLEKWRREADLHDRMRQSLNDHFTVRFEGPEEAALATLALESLDRAYWRIGEALTTFPNQPISVVLYTTEQFRDITRSPSWAAGAYDGTIRVPVRGALDNSKELDRVLAHEFTHALVRTLATRNVPTWLNEGLAGALESSDLDWAHEHITRAHGMIALSALRGSFGRLTGEQAQLAYATSAVTVRRLLDEAGGLAITNLLRDLEEGIDFETAFLHRMQRPFESFQADAR